MRLDDISIKWKLAAPFLFLSFMGTILLAYVGLAYRLELIQQQEQRRMFLHYIEFITEMLDRQQFVLALAESAAQNPHVQKAFEEQDRGQLIHLL